MQASSLVAGVSCDIHVRIMCVSPKWQCCCACYLISSLSSSYASIRPIIICIVIASVSSSSSLSPSLQRVWWWGGRLWRQARSALQTGLQLDALRHSGKYISECPGTPSSIPRSWMAGLIAHIGGTPRKPAAY